ncbi:uncharacterized protein LOC132927134 [Rhopalosiphum padi]|uniref:uncharacterized protein LOC132927134 n=1 Tax=Rhopalosiphum padi TaxID=40932 RepID=UPI00298DAEC6|nr:uncharacterized protein LOC132927134 [Rhopalosiphum padi]
MPASSSGGDDNRPHALNNSVGKIKKASNASRPHNTDQEWTTKTSKKASQSKKVSTPTSPISPTLQQIKNNPPVLNMPNNTFDYDVSLSHSTNDTASNNMNIDIDLSHSTTDHANVPVSANTTYTADISNTNINYDSNDIQSLRNSEQLNKFFSADYNGPFTTIAEHSDINLKIDHWHPLKYAKIFSTNFIGINNIKPIGHKKIKITFNTKVSANNFLTSPLLANIGFTAYIPSTLIYSFGIIRVDSSLTEEDFWEGLDNTVRAIAFKRISIKKNNVLTPTRVVEIKFLSPKIPDAVSIYNVIFKISPSVRSPIQCNNCLRFGHTAKFCRSKSKCSHCGLNDHSLTTCPSINATDPVCIFCKLPHLSTDRNCQEWSFQRDVKKIMATENLPFREAVSLKKNNYSSSAFSYSNIVNKQSVLNPSHQVPDTSTNSFPPLTSQSHYHHTPHRKYNNHSSHSKQKQFHVPNQSNFSLPNGHFIDYASKNRSQDPKPPQFDLTWVNAFCIKLSESLSNSPSLSPLSPSSLQNLIESSLMSCLSIPKISVISSNGQYSTMECS